MAARALAGCVGLALGGCSPAPGPGPQPGGEAGADAGPAGPGLELEGPCPPGMVAIPGGRWITGMKPPLPYGVVDTTKMEVVDRPEARCPEALAGTPGATACWVQTDLHDPVVLPHPVEVEDFCIERWPFPGAGPYPPDGLTTWDAAWFERLLRSGWFGPRRMCTFSEYELAVAGPRSNLRFVYGDRADPSRCPASEDEPIGSRPTCVNPETGVGEYGAVTSQWVRLDEGLVAWACRDPATCRTSGGGRLDERTAQGDLLLRYVVAGGTRRMQTRQAPYTPHTFHDHGHPGGRDGCDAWGWDDQAAVCADPDPRYAACAADPRDPACAEVRAFEAAWRDLLDHCRGARMTECLEYGLSMVEGRPVDICDAPAELGAGQGR